jgi:hypothetical protein
MTAFRNSPSRYHSWPLILKQPKRFRKKLYPDSDSDGIVDNPDEMAIEKTSHYRGAHNGYHRYFKAFLGLNGVDDIMLVSRTGTVFYPIAKSPSFATDLVGASGGTDRPEIYSVP